MAEDLGKPGHSMAAERQPRLPTRFQYKAATNRNAGQAAEHFQKHWKAPLQARNGNRSLWEKDTDHDYAPTNDHGDKPACQGSV